ncbi:MORC family CW-type zinc finger protein 3-like [Littorina saxatilis]|uniref:MORC family CW-type zinc finger protein 3-like n=1 Tax=Littorina saxatilis TaxID=31220 RepID=UPI0038B4386B
MAGLSDLYQAKINPKYLHSNSTNHTWPFSAVAELVDNAYDPDVAARELWIDKEMISGKPCLVFTDNGKGMDSATLYKMMSFGYCEKAKYENQGGPKARMPIGQYGNGFKSGSMRLAKDALVFTVRNESQTASVGFLSQTMCADGNMDTLVLPLLEYTLPNYILFLCFKKI